MAHLAYQQALQWPDRVGGLCLAGGRVGEDNRREPGAGSSLAAKDRKAVGLFQPAPSSTGRNLQVIRHQTNRIANSEAPREQPLFQQSLRNLWAVKMSV